MAVILILDAEPVVRSAVSKILKRVGYTVYATGDFEEAIQMIDSSPPDLLLTNVFLNGITGHDAIKRVKEVCPDLPVLMVSGIPDDEVAHEWMDKDGFDMFPKPFTAEQLIEKVRRVLNGDRHARVCRYGQWPSAGR